MQILLLRLIYAAKISPSTLTERHTGADKRACGEKAKARSLIVPSKIRSAMTFAVIGASKIPFRKCPEATYKPGDRVSPKIGA